MNLILRLETVGKKYIYLLNEVFRPKLTVSNGLNLKRRGKITSYITSPEGEKSFIWANKQIEIDEMDTKELNIFGTGLRLTSDYPSGLYYLVAEIEEENSRNYDSLPFYIESRKVFPFNKRFFELKGSLSPIKYLVSHGHIHSFSNLNGCSKSASDFKTQIQILKKYGVNFIRISLLDMPNEAGTNINTIYPWSKDSLGKYDLLEENSNYFDRLSQFSEACKKEDIFILCYLMDFNNLYRSHNWSYFPLNPDKNIQKSFGFPRKNLALPEWYNLKYENSQLYSIYLDFIKNTLRVLKENPYVIYDLMLNEPEEDVDFTKYYVETIEFIKRIYPNAMVNSKKFSIFDLLEVKEDKFSGIKDTEMTYNNGAWPNDRDFVKWIWYLDKIKKLSNN